MQNTSYFQDQKLKEAWAHITTVITETAETNEEIVEWVTRAGTFQFELLVALGNETVGSKQEYIDGLIDLVYALRADDDDIDTSQDAPPRPLKPLPIL